MSFFKKLFMGEEKSPKQNPNPLYHGDVFLHMQENPPKLYARPPYPKYVIASILKDEELTMLFEANEEGQIISSSEYYVSAKRLGDFMWEDHNAAMYFGFRGRHYEPIKKLKLNDNIHHVLFRRWDCEDHLNNPILAEIQSYW